MVDGKETSEYSAIGVYQALLNIAGENFSLDEVPADMLSVTFEIVSPNIEITEDNISFVDETFIYDGTEKKPAISVVVGEYTLNLEDFDVEYLNNINAGEATIVVKPSEGGNFVFEEARKTFNIFPHPVDLIWEDVDRFIYNGQAQAPSATIEGVLDGDECEVIVSGAQVNASSATYQATATLSNDNYYIFNDEIKNFIIDRKMLDTSEGKIEFAFTSNETIYADGNKEMKPAFTLKIDGVLLSENDYTAEYSNNTKAGDAILTIKAKETSNYDFATIVRQFTISEVAKKSNTGVIIAIVVSSVVVAGGGGFCLYYFVFRKKKMAK